MIDITKKYVTRSGLEVELYSSKGTGIFTIHGTINFEKDGWQITEWTSGGEYLEDREGKYDLVEVKPRIKGWLNVYDQVHSTKKSADAIGTGRLACIEIDIPEGEGL